MRRGNTARCFTAFLAVIMLIVSMSIFPGPMQDATDSLGLIVTAEAAVTYYPKCNSKYTSIVDALNSIGVNSSLSNRKSIAQLNGINNYTGTAAQNTAMLKLLKQGKLIKSKTTDVTPKVTLSSTSVNLDLSGTKSRTITATRSYSGNCYLSYETLGNSNYASFSWGQWQNNFTSIQLTINGLNPGSFQLRVKMYDSTSKQLVATSSVVTVTVSRSSQALPSGSVYLSHGSVNLDLNGAKSQTINATRNYSRDCYLSYETSGNSNYATLSWGQWQNNFTYCPLTISGLNTGSFQLRVKMYDQATKSLVAASNWITVTVKKTNSNVAVTGISLNMTSASVKAGSTVALTATISPSNASNKSVTWSSSNTNVATVSGGTVKGIAAGTATITAKSNNGKTATCKITVTAKTTISTKREKVVKYMRSMATIEWTPKTTFTHWSGGRKWTKGTVYKGIPYSQSNRNTTLETFKKNMSGKTYTGPAKQSTYLGNDCSSAVSLAWKKADSSFTIRNTASLLPGSSKVSKVGSYTYSANNGGTKANCNKNGMDKMSMAYAKLKPGDAVVKRNGKSGHVMLVSSVSSGKIRVIEQTIFSGNSSWRVDKVYTFSTLFNQGYLPIALKGLQ